MVGETRQNNQSAWLQAAVLPGMIVILLVAVILFLPSYLDSYLGDDFVQQWRIRKLLDEPLQAINVFSPDWTDWYYRPLQNLWMLFNRQLFGLTPAAYYLLQVFWHLLCISLLFRAARGFGASRLAGLLAAALFAINAEHHLAVDWISSIGIIAATAIALGTVVVFNHYLNVDQRVRYLVIALLLWLGALLFHETAFLLPIFLFFLRLSHPKGKKADKWLTSFAILALGIMIIYAWMQLTRANANLSPDSILAIDSSFLNQFTELGQFLIRIGGGWIGIEKADDQIASNYGSTSLLFGTASIFFLILSLIVFIKGTRSARLGLIWAGMQVGFIYFVLWSTRPELLGGRHLYSAWAGLSLAIGVAIEKAISYFSSSQPISYKGLNIVQGIVLLLLSSFIIFQFYRVNQSQRSTQALTILIKDLGEQMKSILPEVTDQTRVFAFRFTLSPSYFAPTAGVWYDEPTLTGGDIDTLKNYPLVTSNFYLFDVNGKNLVNLLPGFQEHDKSYLLWREQPNSVTQEINGKDVVIPPDDIETEVIAGPDGDRRLATCIVADSGEWLKIEYQAQALGYVSLAVSYLSDSDSEIRIQLIDESGAAVPLSDFEYHSSSSPPWTDIEIPLDLYQSEDATILFEARSAPGAGTERVCWSNP
jgi:hypothetical protein